MEISKDINHKNLVLIRFNPDNYIDKNGKKINSCWKINKNGTLKIRNQDDWNCRLLRLYEQIEYWCENKTDKTIEVIHLYYDEN